MSTKTIKVKVSAGASKETIDEIAPGEFKVRVQEPPEKGKANERVIEMIALHFKVPKSNIVIKIGAGFRDKVLVVES